MEREGREESEMVTVNPAYQSEPRKQVPYGAMVVTGAQPSHEPSASGFVRVLAGSIMYWIFIAV